MQRLFCVCLNIVDAKLAGVSGAAQKVFNCCRRLACWRAGGSPNKYLNRCLRLSSPIRRMCFALLEKKPYSRFFARLLAATKGRLPPTAPWNPTAPRASRYFLQTTIDVNVNAMKAHPCASMAFISSMKCITHQLLIFRAWWRGRGLNVRLMFGLGKKQNLALCIHARPDPVYSCATGLWH